MRGTRCFGLVVHVWRDGQDIKVSDKEFGGVRRLFMDTYSSTTKQQAGVQLQLDGLCELEGLSPYELIVGLSTSCRGALHFR